MSDEDSKIFNRALYQLRRNKRAAKWPEYDFLKKEAALRVSDRLRDMARRFPVALDLGCHHKELADVLPASAGITHLVSTDMAVDMLPDCVCDEEFLPFADNSFDLVMSVLSLHHVNDVPGTLIQAQRCLKPDGLFIAILPGAGTLLELRHAFAVASSRLGVGLAPRISPFPEIRDAGALLQRAGFALPVIDSDTLTVEYNSPAQLLRDLRGMGESNIAVEGLHAPLSRSLINAMSAAYQEHFSITSEKIRASFEWITLTGWKPHASQQQPAKRGSGKVSLEQLF